MATGLLIPASIPIIEVPGSNVAPTINPYSEASGQSSADGDILILNADGTVQTAATNPSGSLLGIIQHDSQAVYNQLVTGLQGVFGTTQVGSGLLPDDAGQVLVALFGTNNSVVAINLTDLTGWVSGGTYQATVGTQVGLAIDGNGIFRADPNGSNKVAKVLGLCNFPTTQQSFNGSTLQPIGGGGVGDFACRVYISLLSTALAVGGGI